MSHQQLIQTFYESFARGDAAGMVACYHDHIVFHDPAFGELKGNDAKNMWRMLIERSKGEIKITFSDVRADETTGSANWVAEYKFAQTGRDVINRISATFEFRDGKIIRHTDVFDLWKWSRQALGWKGWLLGWSSLMKKQIRKQTASLLKAYTGKE
ncbi:MAG TPA: nuclear transport factor 2 family protein [Bacteroidia bacterium]|nr:nuclear transport factor 2 family protein [Bacteroidia bacterium]